MMMLMIVSQRLIDVPLLNTAQVSVDTRSRLMCVFVVSDSLIEGRGSL